MFELQQTVLFKQEVLMEGVDMIVVYPRVKLNSTLFPSISFNMCELSV